MTAPEVLIRVIEVLDRLGIHYYVTGSLASSFYGEPRATMDGDIVADLTVANVRTVCAEFTVPDYYVSEDAALEAVAHQSQFNIIHVTSGFKIDLMVSAVGGYNAVRMKRRRAAKLLGSLNAFISAPEDVILKKLEFYREGGSDKHLRDIVSMIKVSGEMMDLAYLEEWAARLDVADLWEVVRERAKGPQNV